MGRRDADSTLMIHAVGNRFGRKFEKAGIFTVGQLKDKITSAGLRRTSGGNYYFYESDFAFVPMAGPKTWEVVLGYLDEIGFDWKQYLMGHPLVVKLAGTRQQRSIIINSKINELIGLLMEYRDQTQ